MATLAQIATKIKDLAAAKAPKRTGNLKRKIADFNRPSGMVKESKSKKISKQLDNWTRDTFYFYKK